MVITTKFDLFHRVVIIDIGCPGMINAIHLDNPAHVTYSVQWWWEARNYQLEFYEWELRAEQR